MDDPKIIMSPLCCDFEEAGQAVRVEIYRLENSPWALEVIDCDGTSIVWDDQFKTDAAAKAEFERSVTEEGLTNIITGSTET